MKTWEIITMSFLMAVVATIGTAGMALAYTNSSDIIGGVVVPAACIVTLNGSAIDFGSLAPGLDTGATNQIIQVTNDGNTLTTSVTIEATQWSDGGTNTMVVGQTEWNNTGFTYGEGTALTGSPVSIGSNLAAGGTQNLFFGVGVPVQQAAATYNQTITVTMNC